MFISRLVGIECWGGCQEKEYGVDAGMLEELKPT